MTLALVALLPLFGAALPVWLGRAGRDRAAWYAASVAVGALVLLVRQAGPVWEGSVVRASWAWVPAIGWNASFMLDGLGLMFASLILGIGALIVLYARNYLPTTDNLGRFYTYLLLFMGAMVGVVLADNLLMLVVFWELTSISSFLLIGYTTSAPEGREGARMALAVTGAGGLALLAGAIVLGNIAGTYELSEILASRELVLASPLATTAMVLILLGAFTKSAQFPFHFWLPHAMAAPTPVSAYLHSATMVKAGVFLLARMSPVFAGTEAWLWWVGGAGLATITLAAYWALFKHDLKGLLAYSTISHLGLITLLFGIGSPLAAVAGVFHILNHCAFKAALFMTAGIVDHEAGTRDIRLLGGLRRTMPVTATLAVIAAAAMAGVPPLNGFLSKEILFEEALHVQAAGVPGFVIPAIVVFAALLSVTYSIRFARDTFFGAEPESFPGHPHEPPRGLRLPVEILVVVCIAVGLMPGLISEPMVLTAAAAVSPEPLPSYHIALWHGLNEPLLMSVIALLGGAALYSMRGALVKAHRAALPRIAAKALYERGLAAVFAMSAGFTRALQNGSLQRYVAFLLGTAVVLGASPFLREGLPGLGPNRTPFDTPSFVAWTLLVVTALGTAIFHRRRLIALALLSTVGLVVTLGFVHFSAPDLALTQISVEVVTIVLILMALHLLPERTPAESSGSRRGRDIVLAALAGVGVTGITWAVLTRPLQTIADYYLANSVPGGGGHNVVNVILVDFRGFDTYGEITVLGIAGLGIYALVDGLGVGHLFPDRSELQDEDQHPLILGVIARLILPFALLVSVFLFLRGHNAPGGGFIAALVTSVALIVQYVAFGVGWTHRRLPRDFHPMIGAGLLIAGFTGLGSLWFGAPFLTSSFGHFHLPVVGDFELATASLFDLGVYFAVIGAVMLTLSNLAKLGMREALLAKARQHAAQETSEIDAQQALEDASFDYGEEV
ncbi:MAG: monovalent cation/H+ antiporter subunit A [Acidobacteria bacterium]|nr:monovalent cation/H+ antiporter subunit A [Acidobacteriota bacterium]